MHNYYSIFGYFLFLFFVNFYVIAQRFERNPDVGLYATKLIKKYGYDVEEHTCETEDGYFLTIHRIPNNKVPPNLRKKTPILLIAGLFGTAENFIVGGIINISLAYILADKGYDVWMGNNRGSYWSRKHKTLDPSLNGFEYWNFSWHEIGYYDLPCMIDHILETTNKSQIFYGAHSQGGTIFAVMGAARPEYNKKIKLAILLAPGVFLRLQQNYAILALAWFQNLYRMLPNLLNLHEVVPNIGIIRATLAFLCQEKAYLSNVCNLLFFLGNGLNWVQHPKKFKLLFPVVLDTFPSSVSARQLIHFSQIIDTGKFRQYDYGAKENLKRYNATEPPEYNISNIYASVAIFYGKSDIITAEKGIKTMAKMVQNLVVLHQVKSILFGHVDFLFSENVVRLVYEPMMSLMEQFDSRT